MRHFLLTHGSSSSTGRFTDDESRWRAVTERDATADGALYYAVKTTGVYCRSSCGARLPNRSNVTFYSSSCDADRAGYRPCKRCQPNAASLPDRHKEMVVEACRLIEQSDQEPNLRQLGAKARLSPYYFSRVFKTVVGVTPKQYAIAHRSQTAASKLKTSKTITSAIYDSGYGASSRFYETAKHRHGMTATELRKGGSGVEIRYSFAQSSLGLVVVAATAKGICAVLFGSNEGELVEDLMRRFPKALLQVAEDGSEFEIWVKRTLEYLEDGSGSFDIPLDVRGTAFQERVWRALRDIPPGQTASYGQVAQSMGQPKATRAVAGACAANPIAVIIPCHRVVRVDGSSSGYRWGKETKRELLDRESGRADEG